VVVERLDARVIDRSRQVGKGTVQIELADAGRVLKSKEQ
jgi:hypothetical protein